MFGSQELRVDAHLQSVDSLRKRVHASGALPRCLGTCRGEL